MNVCDEKVLADIEAELDRARAKFPGNVDVLPALTEEVGELNQALIQQKHEPYKGVRDRDVYMEAIQTAVMAIRVASEGDPNFPYNPSNGAVYDLEETIE